MIVIKWETTKSYELKIHEKHAVELFNVPEDDIIGSLGDQDEEDICDVLAGFENGLSFKVDRTITDWKQQ